MYYQANNIDKLIYNSDHKNASSMIVDSFTSPLNVLRFWLPLKVAIIFSLILDMKKTPTLWLVFLIHLFFRKDYSDFSG